ncbi:hypothetical protein A1359_04250 [Methylomonas lenta]|uniref:Uncharacterized protein n=1 Tax=Methylomonas lenta TaxID=980561 RepID=A0A177NMJ1_9GAMM|nr:hypothetical protein A1359_04250 [Methylomonas lenta]
MGRATAKPIKTVPTIYDPDSLSKTPTPTTPFTECCFNIAVKRFKSMGFAIALPILRTAAHSVTTQSFTAIKLRKNNPFSLREKVRMRGLNKAFLPYYKSPLPNPLQQERELFLNLMALTQSLGTINKK